MQALRLERSRAERSHQVFLLALLELPLGEHPQSRATILEASARGICRVVRDTDIVGWYRQGVRVGVVFTLLDHASKLQAKAAIQQKVAAVLANSLQAQEARRLHVSYYFYPDPDSDSASPETLYPDTAVHHASRRERQVKRGMDILGSAILLVLFSPLFAVIAVFVKLSSSGPILFRQTRIGQYGRPFTFLKFRSMYVNSDNTIHRNYVTQLITSQSGAPPADAPQGTFKIVNDPRVTRIGRWLRRSSLDELPQFINVLRGEMSLVGPRPPLPYEFEKYKLWHRRRSMEVRPGITGLWQVNGRSKTTFDDMVRLDLQYASTWSIWLDLKILLRTPAAVLSGDGAY